MTKNRWLKNKKSVWFLGLLCVFVAGIVISRVNTASVGGKKDNIEIQTEFCDLYYPSRWEKNTKILKIGNTVEFRAEIEGYGIQPLFDIHFDSDDGVFCGMIATADGREVSVSQTTYPIVPNEEWDEEQLEMLYAMQEAMNSLLSKLPIVVAEPTEAPETQQTAARTEVQPMHPQYDDIEIATPYGVLRYPDTWADSLRLNKIEADIYTVEFYAKVGDHAEQHLFNIQIGSLPEGGIELYTEGGETVVLDVKFILEELDQTWEDADSDIIYGMMDDINYLLGMLQTEESDP